jgi:hypothetical protein
MNIKSATATLGAALLLAGAPAAAFADTALSNPIVVSDVQVQPVSEDHQVGSGVVSLAFDNTSNQTATEVVFELDSDTSVEHFDDVGSFAPGVTIRHAFPSDNSAADAQLKVVQVKFADGSVWTNNAGPSQPNFD